MSEDPWKQQGDMPPRHREHDTEAERMPARSMSMLQQINSNQVLAHAMEDKMASWEAEQRAAVVEHGTSKPVAHAATEERDIDAADDDLEAIRARRRRQFKAAAEEKEKYQTLGHGVYDEIDEENFLKTVTSSERSVVHFYHKNFERCKILDMHLSKLAIKFIGTRFVKLNAEKAPFFCQKLQITVLPCVVVFVDGVAKGRQLGCTGLGGDEFKSMELAWRLKEWGGIKEEFSPEDDL